MLYHDTVVLLYAKAPVAGTVNTRLIPDIGEQAATVLQHDLIHHRLAMLRDVDLCAVKLMCAPDTRHECFTDCEQQYPITLCQQSGRDLGERMLEGARQALAEFKHCIIIGTDAPALGGGRIKQAIDVLRTENDTVFIPAEDGGYVLLGLGANDQGQMREFLFQDISWGSAQVMQQSRDKLQEKAVPYTELESCWDVDRLEDYQRYLKEIAREIVGGTSD
ncbi:MAG: TIGR04282 family arsenosugar biosynthesis glycosyltransferase [Proteobacteria bacterium]|nr:TIGR04282 family arsenosugar biosynthesis glycosyltransferase [Pseudomonadota bacterium]